MNLKTPLLSAIFFLMLVENSYAKYGNTISSSKCYDQECRENVVRIRQEYKCSFYESVFSKKICPGNLIGKEKKLSKQRSDRRMYQRALSQLTPIKRNSITNTPNSTYIPASNTTYVYTGSRGGYDVSGSGDGQYVNGYVDSDGDGYITLENGSEVSFDGDWTGNGQLDGYDENGNYFQLDVD